MQNIAFRNQHHVLIIVPRTLLNSPNLLLQIMCSVGWTINNIHSQVTRTQLLWYFSTLSRWKWSGLGYGLKTIAIGP
jgi:hypothetical protein